MLLGSSGKREARRWPRAVAVARNVPVPVPFSLEPFRAGVESWRGRPLTLAAVPLASARAAVWVATGAADYVFYDRTASFPGQVRAIAHQIGHMLLGHRGSPSEDVFPVLFPDLDPAVVNAELGMQAAFTSAEEREADAFAACLLARFALAVPGDLTRDL